MEAGVAKTRRRFTAGVRLINMAFVMTTAQIVTLDDFYLETLEAGALPFEFTYPDDTTAGECRITEPLVYEPYGQGAKYWRVSLALEVLP